jgi:hypothetical protein
LESIRSQTLLTNAFREHLCDKNIFQLNCDAFIFIDEQKLGYHTLSLDPELVRAELKMTENPA